LAGTNRTVQEKLDDIRAQVEDITQKYQTRLEEMRKELEDELEPYGEVINSLRHAIQMLSMT